MSEFGESANIAKSRSLALQGVLMGVVLALFSMISISAARLETTLAFLPLMAIFLWPRGASRTLSGLGVFVVGLLVDILVGGPLGLWALIYLCEFALLNPDERARDIGFRELWLRFATWVGLTAVLISVLGRFFIAGATAIWPLVAQGLTAIILFPAIYLVHQIITRIFGDDDDAGFSW